MVLTKATKVGHREKEIPLQPQCLLIALGVPRKIVQASRNGDQRAREKRAQRFATAGSRSFWMRPNVENLLALASPARRKTVKRLHPDRGGDTGEMAYVNGCWERLKRIAARRGYELDELDDTPAGAKPKIGETIMNECLNETDTRERERVEKAMTDSGGVAKQAAAKLGISLATLYRRLDKLGLRKHVKQTRVDCPVGSLADFIPGDRT